MILLIPLFFIIFLIYKVDQAEGKSLQKRENDYTELEQLSKPLGYLVRGASPAEGNCFGLFKDDLIFPEFGGSPYECKQYLNYIKTGQLPNDGLTYINRITGEVLS